MAKKDKMIEILETGLISREAAEKSQEYFREMIVANGRGATHYIAVSYKGGFLFGRTWEVQLWERGK